MKMLINPLLWKTGLLVGICFFLFPILGFAEYQLELTPRISISETYDDNIYLDNANEKADYITAISPGINLALSSRTNTLSIDYAPSFAWYGEYDENNTVRQNASLGYQQSVAEHLRFEFTNSYNRSEEPLETIEEQELVRTTRYIYERNRANADLRYQFGRENVLALGYGNNLLINEDPSLDDRVIQTPRGSISYWMTKRNGLNFNYRFTKAVFWREDGPQREDDYDGHGAGLSYIRRFNRKTSGSIGYDYTTRDFEGLTENYTIHEEKLGFDHAFSPSVSLSLSGGYFTQLIEERDNETGYSYDASLAKRFERGNFSIGGRGGWDEAYLEAEARGFIRFWSANSNFSYQLTKNLNSYIRGTYRQEKDQQDQERRIWRGNCGLSLKFLRWYSLSLDYTYRTLDDDDDRSDYIDNRIMLTLTTAKPWRW